MAVYVNGKALEGTTRSADRTMSANVEELIVELISARFPHLRGAIHVTIVPREMLYEVSKGRSGIQLEVGVTTLTHANRSEILSRLGAAAQQVHAGLTHATRVTALDEAHA